MTEQITRSVYDPTSLDEAKTLAGWFASSGLVPTEYAGHPNKCFAAMAHGSRLGLAPLAAMQAIVVIEGKPALYAAAALAIAQTHPDYVSHSVEVTGEGPEMVATFTITRRRVVPGRLVVEAAYEIQDHVATFSMADAKTAGMLDPRKRDGSVNKKSPWLRFPADMLRARATGRGVRSGFGDALLGLHIAEIAADAPAEEINVTESTAVSETTEAIDDALDAVLDAPTTEPKTMPQALKAIARASEAASIDSDTLRDYVEAVYGPESPAHLPLSGLLELQNDLETEKVTAWLAERIAAEVPKA